MKGAYTAELSPVAHYGQSVTLDDGTDTETFEITQVAPLVGVETDEVTVADGTADGPVKAEQLEIWDGWLAQWRPVNLTQDLPDGVELEVYHGSSTQSVYQTRNAQGRIDNGTPGELTDEDGNTEVSVLSNLLEMYVYEDEPPQFVYRNDSGSSQDISIEFAGFAFNIKPVAQPNGQPVYIPIEGIRGGA